MRSLGILLLSTLSAWSVAGCTPSSPSTDDAAPPDAAPPDAPPPDADPPDASPPDAGPPDAWTAPAECDSIPPGPFIPTEMPGFVASEDLAFDMAGNIIESDTQHIYKTKLSGVREIFVANLTFRAGMRTTPTGELVVNDDGDGALVRVDPDGTRTNLLFGLAYPNGMEVDQKGFVYVTEQNANRVIRVDPFTADVTVLVNGEISNPNGLTFDPTYSHLYIGAFSGIGTIYKLVVNADGTPGELTTWKTGVGTGWNDGMATDECGNVYIADYGASKILRMPPDGSGTPEVVVDRSADWSYMPNFQWGSGIDWSAKHLYIVDVGAGLLSVDMGVVSKPR